ncbi:MAG TPA: PilZ domain-containing protein [Polyangiaceae bacterium]|nr:PilZ domain-containing protein [Polyangiaceae bacterium]
MSSEDRRAPGTSRIPFEGLVEVGGALGPSFEAQAINVSQDGMLLRTAYLPDAGQPLTCRFDAGAGTGVLASGEVVWSKGGDKGGEFAIRFTDMDPESVDALKRLCGMAAQEEPRPAETGTKVRLHIDGLASPMRAKIRSAKTSAITVGSDLGFLQVGKQLELEDAQTGAKRPACIDRVDVTVDPESNVPSLVVTLRYEDVVPSASEEAPAVEVDAPGQPGDDLQAVEDASAQMKSAFARNVALVGPAIERFASRAKTTIALLAKRGLKRSDDQAAPRRTTAPPPGGGLHAEGKRVVRGEPSMPVIDTVPKNFVVTKRKVIVAGAVMMTAIVGAVAIKKMGHEDKADSKATATETTAAPAQAAAPTPTTLTGGAATTAAPMPPPMETAMPFAQQSQAMEPMASDDDDTDRSDRSEHKKHARVTPFGNGAVHHANTLHLKMDGDIGSIEGAQQPTGFTVKIPGRKSLEAAGPLSARDTRIAAIKVSNESAGAELTVSFKDGVPNYLVSAKGDVLVISLAAPAAKGEPDKTIAKKDEKGGKSSKHHHLPGPLHRL